MDTSIETNKITGTSDNLDTKTNSDKGTTQL